MGLERKGIMKRNMFREYMADWSWNKIKEGTSENKAVWSCMYAAFIMMFSASGSIAGENFQLTDALLSIGTFLPIGIVTPSDCARCVIFVRRRKKKERGLSGGHIISVWEFI